MSKRAEKKAAAEIRRYHREDKLADKKSLQRMAADMTALEMENAKLRELLSDNDYIRWRADYNKGHLSWANMIAERERGLNLNG